MDRRDFRRLHSSLDYSTPAEWCFSGINESNAPTEKMMKWAAREATSGRSAFSEVIWSLYEIQFLCPKKSATLESGMTAETCRAQLAIADGAIVGSWLKEDVVTGAPVDPKRVKAFMEIVKDIRGDRGSPSSF